MDKLDIMTALSVIDGIAVGMGAYGAERLSHGSHTKALVSGLTKGAFTAALVFAITGFMGVFI